MIGDQKEEGEHLMNETRGFADPNRFKSSRTIK